MIVIAKESESDRNPIRYDPLPEWGDRPRCPLCGRTSELTNNNDYNKLLYYYCYPCNIGYFEHILKRIHNNLKGR